MFVSLVRVIGFDSKRHVISDKKIKQSKNDVIAFFWSIHTAYTYNKLYIYIFLAIVRNNNNK